MSKQETSRVLMNPVGNLEELSKEASKVTRASSDNLIFQCKPFSGTNLEELDNLYKEHEKTCAHSGFIHSIAHAQHFYTKKDRKKARGWLRQAREWGQKGKIENFSHYIKTLREYYKDPIPVFTTFNGTLTCPNYAE